MAEKLDPFDITALEKSVNDSAVRVSTIWVSYLVFGLYLVIAAGNVAHRQLFLEDSIKLAVLNIDLPLDGFFFLAPVLFVTLHVYVLLQVVLLARTTAVYNEAIEQSIPIESDRGRVRQRLANTLFAQLLAGSLRERKGLIGVHLRLMAWITLAIAPVLVLLVFEFKFLPYHSQLITWAHRVLVTIDLTAVLLLWPLAMEPRRDYPWQTFVVRRSKLLVGIGAVTLSVGVALFSIFAVSFPGEPHANWTRNLTASEAGAFNLWIECRTESFFASVFPSDFDRISVPREDFVDDDKLAKLNSATEAKGLSPSDGERTRNFRNRNFDCSRLSDTDLRRADFADAVLRGASLAGAELQGANFERANLQEAYLVESLLQDASLPSANLQGANLAGARLHGAILVEANLKEANLGLAVLWGANISSAELQGARLDSAHLQGAYGYGTQFQGASLKEVKLHGAGFYQSKFQGAELELAELQGAVISDGQFQGARFESTRLTLATISNPFLWRAGEAQCYDAQVISPRFDAIVEHRYFWEGNEEKKEEIAATAKSVESFVQEKLNSILNKKRQNDAKARMRNGLISEAIEHVANEQAWRVCATNALSNDTYQTKLVEYLVELACTDRNGQGYIAGGIYKNWTYFETLSPRHSQLLARGLLGVEGKPCPGAQTIASHTKQHIRDMAAAPPKN